MRENVSRLARILLTAIGSPLTKTTTSAPWWTPAMTLTRLVTLPTSVGNPSVLSKKVKILLNIEESLDSVTHFYIAEPNRIIVMTGNNHNVEPFLNRTTDVEAIDLARLDTTCTKPADTPIPVSGAFTFWYQDKIWLCGGTQKTLTSSEKKSMQKNYPY